MILYCICCLQYSLNIIKQIQGQRVMSTAAAFLLLIALSVSLSGCSFNMNSNGKFSCDQCDYQTRNKHQLRVHHESFHDGVRYDCQQCDHKATDQSNLRQHIKAIHDGVNIRLVTRVLFVSISNLFMMV